MSKMGDEASKEKGLSEDLIARLKEETWAETVEERGEEDPLLVGVAALKFGLKELQAEA